MTRRKSEVDKFKLFFEWSASKRVEKVYFATLKYLFRGIKKFINERRK